MTVLFAMESQGSVRWSHPVVSLRIAPTELSSC